jgi:hypothetical protein
VRRTELVRVDVGSPARHGRLMIATACLGAIVWLAMSSNSPAEVVYFDNFDDGDRDNDGTTDFFTNNTAVALNDGIPWFRVNPKYFGTTDNPRFFIFDDSVHPVNNPNGIGTGNALLIDQTELSSADFAGFFGQTITLGPNVGDKLVVSFDTRNLDLGHPDSVKGSFFTTLRFGLWQDSDNQFGTQTTDGDGVTATWGEDDGHFDNCATSTIGTCGDYGIWARVQSAAVPDQNPHPATPPDLTYRDFSIAEEVNDAISTGGPADHGLPGDHEFVAFPDAARMGEHNRDGIVDAADYVAWRKDPANNGDPGGYDTWRTNFGDPNALFSDIPIILLSPHTVSLTLERVTPDATGQDVRMEVAVDGIGFGAQPPNSAGGITTRDSFDYFMMTHYTPMDFYAIDNFKVELIAAPGGGSTTVPEPASLQIVILLLLSAFLARRCCH